MFYFIYKRICKVEVSIAIFALVTSVAVIFISAMMRTVDYPINWGTDIALLLFTWSVFLGADVAYRNNATVFVDILVNHLPVKVVKVLKLICYIIILVFMISMVILGIILCKRSWARTFQGIPGFSFSWVTMSVPFSFSLMIITTVRKIYFEYFLRKEAPVPEQEGEE
jgi:TRAP-type C4-dicarboxylate transport system permease small subunit